MPGPRFYNTPEERLAALETKVDDLEVASEEVRDQLKWQTRALIGAILTMLTTLAVVLAVLPHG